jgi:hypothetical protein
VVQGGFSFGKGQSGPPFNNQGGSPFGKGNLVGVFPGGAPGVLTFAGAQWNSLDPKLVSYLEKQQGKTRYLVATATSSYASLFMLDTNAPAMALGGYQGWDRIVTPAQLAQMTANGVVRFFYIAANQSGINEQAAFPSGQNNLADVNDDLIQWVHDSCKAVPQTLWQTSTNKLGVGVRDALQLYNCAAHK